MSSADNTKKQPSQNVGKVILPRAVEDKSLIDSFTGFIQDVVPQACSGVLQQIECKDKILWARFEQTDANDPIFYTDTWESITSGIPSILLVLGYNYGVQVWSISANGEASEVFSWCHGVVKCLKLIPSPQIEQNDQQDLYTHRRPLIVICESTSHTSQFCNINFFSLRGGDIVKSIKFKSAVLDIAVNRISIVVTFVEKIAVFNSCTLENDHTITTCYTISNTVINPIALSGRWLAYSDQKLIQCKKSLGGCETEYSQSYTATVISAAKSLSVGLRELSGSVAFTFSGNPSTPPSSSVFGGTLTNSIVANVNNVHDNLQPGVITIVDIKKRMKGNDNRKESTIAHFVAHSDQIVAMAFDPSGLLLLTADKKGHHFNVFRIQAHLLGSAYASVHHLYILYRGDTTARIQDISFSVDSRWVAVTSLRGTTHVFPITPYGGAIGLRTHSTPHVVNKLSRFHRSAGIISDGRNSPVLHEAQQLSSSPNSLSYPNPCLPPFPHPTTLNALTQIRSPLILQSRHLTSQASDESSASAINVVAYFSPPRLLNGTLLDTITTSFRKSKSIADSLFVMSSHGTLVQYDLEPRPLSSVPRDKLCDETAVELKVDPKIKWYLVHPPSSSNPPSGIQLPLGRRNPLLATFCSIRQELVASSASIPQCVDVDEDRWLSQVEIVTHIGPHRRIWMGPQFTFKPDNKSTAEISEGMAEGSTRYAAQSHPVNMPNKDMKSKNSFIPFFIESGSASSFEQSPRLLEPFCGVDSDSSFGIGELKIQEDLADAMMESPTASPFNQTEASNTEMIGLCPEKLSTKKSKKMKKKRK